MRNSGDYIPRKQRDLQGPGDRSGSRQLLKLRRLVQILCRLSQAIEEAAQSLLFFTDGLEEGDVPEPQRHKPSGSRRPPNGEDTEVLQQLANLGVTIEIAHNPDGSAIVTVGQTQKFRLNSPILVDLLVTLTEDSGSGPGNDGLVGWKSAQQLRQRLGEKRGRNLTCHAIAVSIHRLRLALLAAGLNRFLVQTNRRMGFRFARKVKESPEIGGNLR